MSTAKFIRVGENKGFRVEGILVGEEQAEMVTVRQMYKTKRDPTWKPGRNGFTIPRQYAGKLAKAIGVTSQQDPSRYTALSQEQSE